VHGGKKKYYHEWIGMNSRLDALQASVLRVKLRYLDGWSEGRAKNAEHYRTQLAKLGVPVAPLTPTAYQTRHIYNQFVIRSANRDALQAHLKAQGIGTEVYYPVPMHLQPCYAFLGHKPGDFPVSEKLAAESLALPVHSDLPAEDIDAVCDAIQSFYA
jgi:dTDP-4-amino-4,6-dideoxygalactose transaminase